MLVPIQVKCLKLNGQSVVGFQTNFNTGNKCLKTIAFKAEDTSNFLKHLATHNTLERRGIHCVPLLAEPHSIAMLFIYLFPHFQP